LPVRGAAGTAVVVGIAVYAWWAAGLAPFTTAAYVAVALPVAALATAALLVPTGPLPVRSVRSVGAPGAPVAQGRPWYRALPWAGPLAVAVGLEVAGLALGGRSSTVPTLSTVVDHALAWQAVRFVLFLAWLALGWAPVVRRTPFWRRTGA
jgi:hypothetical protein